MNASYFGLRSFERSRSEAGRNRSIEPGLSPPVFCIWLLARPLHSEHSLQNTEHLHPRVISQNTQPLNQPISIDSPELINNLVSIFVIKSATYAKRIVMTTYCKWRNDKRAEMKIKLIRGDVNARSRFPDYSSSCGIIRYKINIPS